MTTSTTAGAATAARGLILGGLLVALHAGFLGLTPFKIGYWGPSEAIGAALHASAALVAIGLAVLALADRPAVAAAIATPVVWPPLLLAAWSGLFAPAAQFPLLSLFGAPQLSEGVLLHLDMALWTAGALCLRGAGRWGTVVALGAALPAIVMPLVFAFQPHRRLYFYPDWLAFYGLLAPAIIIGFTAKRGHGEGRWKVWLIAGLVAALPLAVSGNRAATAAALAMLPAFLLLERIGPLSRVWRPLVGTGLALVPPVGFLIIWYIGTGQLNNTLWSRLLAIQVAAGAFQDSAWTWVIGQGWGHDMFGMLRHLDRVGQTRFLGGDTPWDLALRDYFHSHHGGFQALLSAGIPGAIVFCLQPLTLALTAPRGVRFLAGATAAALALTLCFWFQTTATVAFQAIAFAALAGPGKWRIPATSPAFAAAALGLAAAVAFQLRFGLPAQHDLETWSLTAAGPLPGACAEYPPEDWRGNLGLARVIGGRIVQSEQMAGREGWTDARADRLSATICLLEQRLERNDSVYLLFWALELRGRIAHLDAFALVRQRFTPLMDSWAEKLRRFLALAPGRSDMAIGYFGWAIGQGRYAEAVATGAIILNQRPDDPIGLWFSGNAMLFDSDTTVARQGLARMKRALTLGVEQFAPIDPGLKRRVEAA